MYIHQDNFVIRSAVAADAEILTGWWNDGTVMAHAGFPNGLGQSIEETRSQIQENERKLSQRCMIEIDDKPVGEMVFYLIEKGTAEIGIKICDAQYQNHGYGTRLIRRFLQYLFEDSELNNVFRVNKVILDTNLENKRAQHVYEKLGFTRLRVNIGAWTDQLGRLQDSVDYEMTREFWENGKR